MPGCTEYSMLYTVYVYSIQYAVEEVVLGCTLHQNALTCISQAIFTVIVSETADSTDAAHENNL